MKRRTLRNFSRAVLLATVALLLAATSAGAAVPAEGGFEDGLAAWTRTSLFRDIEWRAEARADAEENFGTTLPAAVGPFVAASEYGGPDTGILAQTFTLPADAKLDLSLYLFYSSESPIAVPTPDTLVVDPSGEGDNQQVRVDVLKANAPLESVSPNDILATLYASAPGAPEKLGPTLLEADLSQFAGQTVTLRIANAVSGGAMITGVGDVALTATPLPPTPPVPAAGTLIVSDARRKAAVASAYSAPRRAAPAKPVLIRTASATVDHGQTVHIPLRPTAAAMRLLNKNGRVAFRLQLTFDSARGAVSTATYKGVLIKRTRR